MAKIHIRAKVVKTGYITGVEYYYNSKRIGYGSSIGHIITFTDAIGIFCVEKGIIPPKSFQVKTNQQRK